MKPERNHRLKPTVAANTAHFKKLEHRQTQKHFHITVGHEDDNQKVHDWGGQVKTDLKIDAYFDKFIGMMPDFESMWDRDQSQIIFVKLCIKSGSDEISPKH